MAYLSNVLMVILIAPPAMSIDQLTVLKHDNSLVLSHIGREKIMNRLTQHIPNFVETRGEQPPTGEFETTEELLSLEVVQRYKHDDFSHFAMSDNHLMVISDDGFKHWVVGYVKNPESVDLPKWAGWKFRAELPNGEKVILSSEVVSSCGDVLTLRDGTKATNLDY